MEEEVKEENKQKLKELVMWLMTNIHEDRNSDYALYADYINHERPDIPKTKYYEVMQHHKDYGIFSFKSVERTRRAIQEEARECGEESLLSDKQVQKYRKELEEKYKKEYGGKK